MPSQIAFLLRVYSLYAPGWRWPDGDAEDGLAIWSMTPANNRSERDHDFAIVSPSRFLGFFVFLPPKNEMKKDHVAELVDGSEIRGNEAKKDGNFHLIFDAVRTGRLMGPKLVCVGGTSRNAKTCLKQVMQLVGNQGDFWLNYVKMR
ncbi:hypothetical protein DAPPUDRAFT_99161 [Daphnia pulex]|uniref:Uncharacterized protein n=1 Tax=Daphnia pulex TaxID=6669 RepID=E9G5U4_DAPPU|nr:hypothetical protein DAPPUDRAFT_99161 [Daphnia pulex]|eukprot:EFX84825.1 hypothetical protein DAPPUDRAFT_99161 [Daphnia pulex]